MGGNIYFTIFRLQSIAAVKSYIQELGRAGHNIFRVRHREKGIHPHCLLHTSASILHSCSQIGAKWALLLTRDMSINSQDNPPRHAIGQPELVILPLRLYSYAILLSWVKLNFKTKPNYYPAGSFSLPLLQQNIWKLFSAFKFEIWIWIGLQLCL